MAYAAAGIQMFMKKLKQLINCHDNPLIDSPLITFERPQVQLLYDDLGSVTQTLLIGQQHRHHLEQVNDLKKRLTDAVEEAQYIVDMFLSNASHWKLTQHASKDFNHTLNLDEVRRSLNSVSVEFMSMKMMDSSTRPERRLIKSAAAPMNSEGSKKLLDETVIGVDRDVELIRDKLVEDQKKVNVVSIVGMGGIGKTTLATLVFNDGYVKHHFHVRAWVIVSQTYDKRGVLIQILASIGVKEGLEEASDSRLCELVHKKLMANRYLIVIDDIWHVETWDNLKLISPHNNNGSRILLTSRLTEVANHANSHGLIHHLGYMNKERSWELLCQKVFRGNECPEWSVKPGMQIVENCQGLPLVVVVIAGVLAKQAWSEEFWVEIAKRTGAYVVGDDNGCLETLGLSYNNLPLQMKDCFLYLGCFPEDYEFQVRWLIWLWVAEGFVQEDENKRLEDIAEGYLMDLIDRNLVIVADTSYSSGVVKACRVHDLVREVCRKKAKEEQFILQTEAILSSQFSNVVTPPYKPVRVSVYTDINILDSVQNLRTLLCFGDFRSLSNDIAKYFCSFAVLRVLDLQHCKVNDFPEGIELLVHLTYLAIWNYQEISLHQYAIYGAFKHLFIMHVTILPFYRVTYRL